MSRPYRPALVSLLPLLFAACDRVSAPRIPGVLRVSTATTGLDVASYIIVVDGGQQRVLAPSDSVTVKGLSRGSHTVLLSDVGANCSVQAPNPQVVDVEDDVITDARFVVRCTAKSAFIQVTTATTGLDAPASYTLRIDDKDAPPSIATNGTSVVPNVSGGDHVVRLGAMPANCSLSGDSTQKVRITLGATRDTLRVAFNVACVAATGVIELVTTSSGLDAPANYTLGLDGGDLTSVATIGSQFVSGVPGGHHIVSVRGLPSNCLVAAPSSHDVDVTVGGTMRDTVRVAFTLSCTALNGFIEITLSASGSTFGEAFGVSIDHAAPQALLPSTTTRVVAPLGEHVVKLIHSGSNCSVAGTDSTVAVISSTVTRDTVRASFQISCTSPELIALSRNESIYVINPDGSNPMQLSDGYDPAWSPAQNRIVLSRQSCDYYDCSVIGLFVLDFRSSTKSITQLTSGPDVHPAWSPDGSTIAFIRGQGLYLIHADGAGVTRIPLPSAIIAYSRVTWSPDGSRLAFVCRTAEPYDDICAVNTDGSRYARLTFDGLKNSQPSWSPDGAVIAFARTDFQSDRDANSQQYVALMHPDGTGLTRLATGTDPAWSPDGQTIVFRNGAAPGLATVKRDGTGLKQITTEPSDYEPVWHP